MACEGSGARACRLQHPVVATREMMLFHFCTSFDFAISNKAYDLSLPPSHVTNLPSNLNTLSADIPHNTSYRHADLPWTVDVASGRGYIGSHLYR